MVIGGGLKMICPLCENDFEPMLEWQDCCSPCQAQKRINGRCEDDDHDDIYACEFEFEFDFET
jgi:hypothetical protein